MLVMTAPAYSKMKAFWRNPIRRGFQHLDQFGADVPGFFFQDPNGNGLSGQGKGNKNGAPVGKSSEGIAAVSKFFQFNGQQVRGHGSRGLKCNRQVAKNAASNYATHPPLLKILKSPGYHS